MIGTRFTRLTVIKELDRLHKQRRYLCRCDCGSEIAAYRPNLLQGRSRSCGCLKRELTSRLFTTHGMSQTTEYKIWAGIRKRCYTTTYREYHLYGGRGIRMAREWKRSFEAFYRDMGARPSPSHSIERKDNNRGYNKDNCVWALAVDQTRNRRIGHFVRYNGQRMHLKQFSDLLKHSYFSIYAWVVRDGMSPEQAAAKAISLQSAS
jgi:hypothetical protein